MFAAMLRVLKVKMDGGNGVFEWNSEAESFYEAIREMALGGVISEAQWDTVVRFVEKTRVSLDGQKTAEKDVPVFRTRYQARKHAKYGDMVVKVEGGYILMDTREFYIWKAEREERK